MNKLNNKGFTLVEVLAVIAILAIVMVIAIPNISSSIERSNNKKNEALEKVIKSEAELYVSNFKNLLSFSDNKCYIDIKDLVNNGQLDEKDIEGYSNCCLIYNVDGEDFEIYNNGLSNDRTKCNNSINVECYER